VSRRILIVVGHPDPSPDRLCRGLARAYGEGAEKAGHAVRRVDLAAIDFPMLRTMQEFEHGSIPYELKDAAEAIVWAEHIVFVFPLWLGTMPAMLKALLEQVMRSGTAFAYPDKGGGFTKTLLRGRTARVVVTMGMPSALYRLCFLDTASPA
jgi:putative NADPH-quinone reductase